MYVSGVCWESNPKMLPAAPASSPEGGLAGSSLGVLAESFSGASGGGHVHVAPLESTPFVGSGPEDPAALMSVLGSAAGVEPGVAADDGAEAVLSEAGGSLAKAAAATDTKTRNLT